MSIIISEARRGSMCAHNAFACPDEPDGLARAVNDVRLGSTVRRLQALGAVHVGMASSWEFVEL